MNLPKFPIKVKPIAGIVICSVFVGGVAFGVNTVTSPSHNHTELVKSASATTSQPAQPSNSSDPTTPDPSGPVAGGSAGSSGTTTGTASSGSTGGTNTPSATDPDPSPSPAPDPAPAPAPTVTNIWQTRADNGATTTITCHYSWTDGTTTDKFAASYPDVQPDPANGIPSIVVNASCPDA